ncbi:FliC/FljB family flagellin [Escherichia coli]|uniref:FliC/FljB family flagellin n=1 Tax=Escherichia coli TaxID=562 RepID=UPI000BB623CA|nr:FliC/FljB family flagellin [Escherichia coli]EFB7571697.1 FliC/FljB family flagellin [Escherichia coli]EHT8280528.1 FliC/FljB family flagellin [Escherichia coli]EKH2442773.1 FliC/FljB family flagellin [Escherichia coli]PBR55574.1 flagellin FliC [Escherichia coli]HAG5913352.1 FliC/FljB family flagellin [Escherichia coli]
MAQVINTNSLSLITQNNINKNQSALSSSIERLSSGLRINSAKDDAAGQAIANRFTSNIKGLTQAARNANDGISVAQTTEGALSEINNNLQRIRELTVQASTGTNSDSDLDSIQDEIKSRLDEIDRVSGQTQFNGVNVLAKDGSMKIQVGANDGQTITIDLKKIDSDTLGLSGFNVNGSADKASVAATADGMVKDGYIKGLTSSDGSTAYTKTTANTAAKGSDILAALKTGDKITATGANSLADNATSTTYTYNATSNTFSYTADGVNQTNAAANLIPAAGKTTAASVTIGGTAQNVNIDDSGNITSSDGDQLYLDSTGNLTKNQAGNPNKATVSGLLGNTDANGTAVKTTIKTEAGVTVTAEGNTGTVKIEGATVSASAFTGIAYSANTGGNTYAVAANNTTNGFLAGDDLTQDAQTVSTYYSQADGTVTNSAGKEIYKDADGVYSTENKTSKTSDPLAALDDAISSIDKFRSSLGAIQNRLDSAVTNLNNTTTNLSEAQSRIQDADYATEVSNMSKAQIIQQAGNSVLAKANQVPQQVLSLLQG